MRFIQKSNNKETVSVSFMNSFWRDERYVRASYVNVVLMTFRTLTGYAAVKGFSTSIFKSMQEKDPNGITPRSGAYLVGTVNLVGAAFGMLFVKLWGRRPLILYGQIAMASLLFAIALTTVYS